MNKFFKKILLKYIFNLNRFRLLKIKILGATIGKGVIAYGRFTGNTFQNLSIGENTTINEGVLFNCMAQVEIGSRVHLSSNVQIHTSKLLLDKDNRVHTQEKIIIKDNVWIASSCVILSGVVIGENSVIAAGSVVTRDIPPNSLAMGIPAIVVRKI